MARRRRKTSATDGNLDSMLDTLTNVVGILVIVLVTVQLSTQEAASRIAEAVARVDPGEIDRLEREAEAAEAGIEEARRQLSEAREAARKDPAAELARLAAEAAVAEELAAEARKKAAAAEKKQEVARRQLEAKRREQQTRLKKAREERKRIEVEREALLAKLDAIEPPESLPAKEVRLPDPRPAPEGAEELPVLCREGRIIPVEVKLLRDRAQKRAAMIVAQKKLDPDGDTWLSDGKLFEKEFNARPIRSDDFELRMTNAGNRWPRLILDPRPGAGDEAAAAVRGNGDFIRALRLVGPEEFYLRFYVWPDSYEAYLLARQAAGQRGFAAGWVPLASDHQYTIPLGRYAYGTKPPPSPPKSSKKPSKPKPPPNVID